MSQLLAVPVRLLAFLGKEIIETIRRPGALFSLVLGPFLIMAIFGLGYDGYRNPLRTVVVAPEGSGLPQDHHHCRGARGSATHPRSVNVGGRAPGALRARASGERRK